jgi:hypothetical protein
MRFRETVPGDSMFPLGGGGEEEKGVQSGCRFPVVEGGGWHMLDYDDDDDTIVVGILGRIIPIRRTDPDICMGAASIPPDEALPILFSIINHQC